MSAGDWKDLYQAAVDGNLSLVEYHIREKEGHREIAHYLLAHGADPGLVSELDDLTPLQAARKYGHEEFVALFLGTIGVRPQLNLVMLHFSGIKYAFSSIVMGVNCY